MPKEPMTAGELMKRLARDPEHVQIREEKGRARREAQARQRLDEAPLLRALRGVGIEADSVWNLVDGEPEYESAIPLLLEHLDGPYNETTREGIVRALTVPHARGFAGGPLVRAFREESDDDKRWVVGNALSVVATREELSDIEELLRDERYGSSRSRLVHALVRLRGHSARQLVHELLSEGLVAVVGEAIEALGRLGGDDVEEAATRLETHDDPWVREQARKVLRRDKKRAKPR